MRPRRTPVLLDVLLAAVLSALSVTALVEDRGASATPLGVLLAVLAIAPIALRQVTPVLTLVAVAAALVAHGALGYGDTPSSGAGLVIALFTVATLRPRPVAAAAYAATVLALAMVLASGDGVTWTMFVQSALLCLCAWGLGDATRRWAEETRAVAAEAERSVARERTRIARELHDVVTHHMSVVALQTGLAEYVLDTDVPTARTAMGHAGDACREALHDLGRMLDALRAGPAEDAPYDPQPGLGDLDGLVQRLGSAGLEVGLRRSGDVRPLGAGAELCAYRVVQESLTNVLKHAGPGTRAAVDLAYGERVLTVEVTDDGRGSGAAASHPGHPATPRAKHPTTAGSGLGVRGMQERAELYGGVLEAGPATPRGYAVRLRLPLGSTSAPGTAATTPSLTAAP